jgi:hypothetical protein
MPLLHTYAHTKYMNDCTYIQITIKRMKYKVKGRCSFFLATGSSYYIRLQRLDQSLSTTMQPSSIKITQNQGRKGPTGTMHCTQYEPAVCKFTYVPVMTTYLFPLFVLSVKKTQLFFFIANQSSC